MLSKNKLKTITALHQKKFRNQENLFIAEGEKVISDLIAAGWKVQTVVATREFLDDIEINETIEVIEASDEDMSRITTLATHQSVLAIAEMPKEDATIDFTKGLKIVLDNVKDPGNLGAILRIADWFGIEEIICSNDTVDCFNPKVVMASMGSLFHLKVIYTDLKDVFEKNKSEKNLPVYGTMMEGKNVFEEKLAKDAFIILGNESNGVSEGIQSYITNAIHIPSFSTSKNGLPDSLNVSVAAGIVIAQFRVS
jgi:TrmH family RNA methyltransferase